MKRAIPALIVGDPVEAPCFTDVFAARGTLAAPAAAATATDGIGSSARTALFGAEAL